MSYLKFNREELVGLVEKMAAKSFAMDMPWDWPSGVAFYGVSEAYKVTKNIAYIDWLKGYVDEYITLGVPPHTVNTCAMGHCLITLFEETGEAQYWDLVEDKIKYLQQEALRFGNRVLQHTVSVNNDFPEQAWADTLFMAAFFMLRVGVIKKDEELIDDALNQYYWHIQYLQDPDTSLWYHGYNHIEKNNMSGLFWGRANAWAAYTMSQVQKILPEPYLYPKFMEISGSLNEQLSALKSFQTEKGLWRTIINDQESYEEISASCGIAAAMLANGNVLHLKYVQKTLDEVLVHIADNGKVLNVSGGTAVMRNPEGYRTITKKWAQGWGQGLALAFFTQLLRFDGEGEQ